MIFIILFLKFCTACLLIHRIHYTFILWDFSFLIHSFFSFLVVFSFLFKSDPLTFIVRLVYFYESFNFCLSEKLFISLFILNDIFAEQSILGCKFFPFSTLNKFCHSLLPAKFLLKKPWIACGGSSCTWLCFSPADFKTVSLTFTILSMMCLGVGLFAFILVGTFHTSYSWICFFSFRKFPVLIL